MWLLNFLLGAYNAVLDWFSSKYWYWRNLVDNLPNTIAGLNNSINYYFNLARQGLTAAITAFYNSYIAPAISQLEGFITDIRIKAEYAYNLAYNFANDISNRLASFRDSVIGYIVSKYDSWIGGIQATINRVINQDIPSLLGKLGSLLPFQAWLQSAASNLNIDNIKKMLIDLDNMRKMLTIFVANPIGFILGLFWQYALTFLGFVIGYALGTTKYQLPSIPDWNSLTKK